MSDEEMIVDFDDNDIEKDEDVANKDNKSKNSEFSLELSDPNNNISAEKSPTKSNKNAEDLLENLNREDSSRNVLRHRSTERNPAPHVESIATKSRFREQRDIERKKVSVSDKKKSGGEEARKRSKDKPSKKNDPYYFILKFPGDNALNTCLDNNFIILSPGLSDYFDIIEVNFFIDIFRIMKMYISFL